MEIPIALLFALDFVRKADFVFLMKTQITRKIDLNLQINLNLPKLFFLKHVRELIANIFFG